MPQFLSKHRNLRLTRRPHVEVGTATGAYRTIDQPVRYSFAPDGVLDVEEGQDLMADGAPVIDPETGGVKRDAHGFPVFETQDAVGWLRSHADYNQAEVIGGFTESGREPDRIPDAGPRVTEIIEAMAALDVGALQAFADEEEAAPYSRPAVDAALEAAAEQVNAAIEAGAVPGGGDGGGTPGNAAEGHPSEEALDAIDKMADLVRIGERFGLELGKPGQSKDDARELIREKLREKAAA